MSSQHFSNANQSPINFFSSNDERWSDADNGIVRFLAEDAQVLQLFAIGSSFDAELHTYPQAAPPNFLDDGAAQCSQFLQQIFSQLGGAFAQLFLLQNAQGRARYCTGKRVASKSTAVISRLEHAEDFLCGQHCGNRIETARKRFPQNQDVRLNPFVHVGEHLACPPKARLNFIQHEEYSILFAKVCCFSQITVRRQDDSSFPLDRLNQECTSVGGDGFAQSLRISKRNYAKSRSEGTKTTAVARFAREAHNGNRTAMKVAGTHHNLSTVVGNSLVSIAPSAGRLDRRFDCFRTRVHQQNHVHAG